MPSAYILAKDHIEQARAMLANEVWFDAEMDQLLEIALAQLTTLDAKVYDDPASSEKVRPLLRRRARMMPWLDP